MPVPSRSRGTAAPEVEAPSAGESPHTRGTGAAHAPAGGALPAADPARLGRERRRRRPALRGAERGEATVVATVEATVRCGARSLRPAPRPGRGRQGSSAPR